MATIHKFPDLAIRDMSPEALWLSFVAAKATIAAIDARCVQDGRDPTEREDRDWREADVTAEDITAEFKRRIQSVLGPVVKLDDLIGRGAL